MADAKIHYHQGPGDYPQPDFSAYQIRATGNDDPPFPPDPTQIKSILILKLDALGDYLLHTPFFSYLRKFYPHAKITLVCVQENLSLVETNPAFDTITPLPFPSGADQRMKMMFGMELQSHASAPFDLIIVPRWSEDWHHAGVIAHSVGAPYRLSYSAQSTPMKRQYAQQHDDYFTHVIDDTRPAHEVWRGMQLLHALGMEMPPITDIRQELHTTMDDTAIIDALFTGKNYPRPWIALGVGASIAHKRWPGEKFAQLVAQLDNTYGGTVFILGHGEEDAAAAAAILNKSNKSVNCVGNLSPRTSGTLIQQCDMMVTNDSFALHAAATVGTPAVEVVGHPADGNPDTEYLPWRFGPWGIPFAWVQPVTCGGSACGMADYLNEVKC
ncbi:MAG TPA: glycosyltransferase family 9 protein, partial [Alphaproteobacteria bacterium]|nr:glycosyltransferase family 9 protein [Alphaproteobacteria bacterium]